MAASSLTMTASFLTTTGSISSTTRRGTMAVRASSNGNNGEAKPSMAVAVKNGDNGRRELVFAAAAAAVYSIANVGVSMADDEPRRGSAEAKKKYGPVCIANPTARICRF